MHDGEESLNFRSKTSMLLWRRMLLCYLLPSSVFEVTRRKINVPCTITLGASKVISGAPKRLVEVSRKKMCPLLFLTIRFCPSSTQYIIGLVKPRLNRSNRPDNSLVWFR